MRVWFEIGGSVSWRLRLVGPGACLGARRLGGTAGGGDEVGACVAGLAVLGAMNEAPGPPRGAPGSISTSSGSGAAGSRTGIGA